MVVSNVSRKQIKKTSKVKEDQHCLPISRPKDWLGLLGTANTLTVMVNDCDRSMESGNLRDKSRRVFFFFSFNLTSSMGLGGRICAWE